MNTTYYLACDLHTDCGRIILGTLIKSQLNVQEIHRFPIKTQTGKSGAVCWDLAALEKEIFTGIEKAALLDLPISGLSASSWGGDYVMVDAKNRPLQSPGFGAGRGDISTARLLQKLPLNAIYAETGIPLMPLHTLFQLEAEHRADPVLFQRAERFLPIADYLNTCFSGVTACEESLASTTQLYNPKTHARSPQLLAALGLPDSMMPRLVPSGTAFGPVVHGLRRHPALLNTRVVATCSHEKAAAIAAIPARSEQQWAFLRFGQPLAVRGGAGEADPEQHGVRRRVHERGRAGRCDSFFQEQPGADDCGGVPARLGRRGEELSGGATDENGGGESGPAKAHISPDDPRFREPAHMPEEIAAYCRETGQSAPVNPGEYMRVILESLALAHAETLGQLEGLTGQEIEVLHIVGRGARNGFLNQLVADMTDLPVMVGPADAAAIGNVLVQALALWHLKSPDHLRSIVATSFPTQVLKPGQGLEKKIREKFRALSERREQAQPMAA